MTHKFHSFIEEPILDISFVLVNGHKSISSLVISILFVFQILLNTLVSQVTPIFSRHLHISIGISFDPTAFFASISSKLYTSNFCIFCINSLLLSEGVICFPYNIFLFFRNYSLKYFLHRSLMFSLRIRIFISL